MKLFNVGTESSYSSILQIPTGQKSSLRLHIYETIWGFITLVFLLLVSYIFIIIAKLPVTRVSLCIYPGCVFWIFFFLKTQAWIFFFCVVAINILIAAKKKKEETLIAKQPNSLPLCFKVISLETNAGYYCVLLLYFVHGPQHCRKIFFSPLPFRSLPFFIADFLQCSWSKPFFPLKDLNFQNSTLEQSNT